MVIYEVNIRVNNNIYNQYMDWLKNHLQDMLKIDGFNHVNVYNNCENNKLNSTKMVVVQYEVESLTKLQDYFNHQAQKMRSATLELFGDSIQINRRVLEAIECI